MTTPVARQVHVEEVGHLSDHPLLWQCWEPGLLVEQARRVELAFLRGDLRAALVFSLKPVGSGRAHGSGAAEELAFLRDKMTKRELDGAALPAATYDETAQNGVSENCKTIAAVLMGRNYADARAFFAAAWPILARMDVSEQKVIELVGESGRRPAPSPASSSSSSSAGSSSNSSSSSASASSSNKLDLQLRPPKQRTEAGARRANPSSSGRRNHDTPLRPRSGRRNHDTPPIWGTGTPQSGMSTPARSSAQRTDPWSSFRGHAGGGPAPLSGFHPQPDTPHTPKKNGANGQWGVTAWSIPGTPMTPTSGWHTPGFQTPKPNYQTPLPGFAPVWGTSQSTAQSACWSTPVWSPAQRIDEPGPGPFIGSHPQPGPPHTPIQQHGATGTASIPGTPKQPQRDGSHRHATGQSTWPHQGKYGW